MAGSMNIDPVVAEILKSIGRLEAKVDMLMSEESADEAEDKKEGEGESDSKMCAAPSPEYMSTMLNDVGQIF